MNMKSTIISILFITINLYSSKITIWNNSFDPIKATVIYSSDKTHEINIDAASHKSWDNVSYNMKSVQINTHKLPLEQGISKHFDVNYDGNKLTFGKGLNPKDTFLPPDPSLKYNEVCFLASHNAHSAIPYGYLYAQQDKKIKDQLLFGARTLLLDTYPANKSDLTKEEQPQRGGPLDNYEVMMWHGPIGHNLKMKFIDTLEVIKEFLISHPREIVTIQLENYVDPNLIDKAIERSNISSFILKPIDWDPNKKNGWPTIKWMIDNNKRLVIFDSRSGSLYSYYQWSNTIENQYGTLDIEKAAKLRGESSSKWPNCYLLTINYFGTVTSPDFANNSTKLRKLIDYIFNNGLHDQGILKQRYPNFIALDFINRGMHGDPLLLVNEINHKSKTTKDRSTTIFRPIILPR